jgi:diaminopimelate epimerase
MTILRAQGTGNEFIVLIDPDGSRRLSADLARALCDRTEGPGADGAIRVAPGPAGADVVMDHRNADGSLAQMCGNGVRVVARVALEHGLIPADAHDLVVSSLAGPRPVEIRRDPAGGFLTASVAMGQAQREPADVPFEAGWARPDMGGRWHLEDVPLAFDVVSMGNPHAVVAVDDLAQAPLDTLGLDLQSHPAFPEGVNVGFLRMRDADAIDLRVLERGVGETQACGTGACAAVAALHARQLVSDQVAVHVPGGVLTVRVTPDGLILEGPAEIVEQIDLASESPVLVDLAAADGWHAGHPAGAAAG